VPPTASDDRRVGKECIARWGWDDKLKIRNFIAWLIH